MGVDHRAAHLLDKAAQTLCIASSHMAGGRSSRMTSRRLRLSIVLPGLHTQMQISVRAARLPCTGTEPAS